jgi:hypothetical protein
MVVGSIPLQEPLTDAFLAGRCAGHAVRRVCMGVEPTRPQVGMLAENPELAGLIVIYYAEVAIGAICFGQVCCVDEQQWRWPRSICFGPHRTIRKSLSYRS